MARLEFFVSLVQNPSRFSKNLSSDLVANEEQEERQFQVLREEYQEILQLYHEVLEYRHMSCATDEEIKGEIEHLIKLLTPVVQMEPHHRILNEIGNCDNISSTASNTETNTTTLNQVVTEVESEQSNNLSATAPTATPTLSSSTNKSNHSTSTTSSSNETSNDNGTNSNSDNNGCTLA